jgi:hypothetical protein
MATYVAAGGIDFAASGDWLLAIACGYFPALATMRVADVLWWRNRRGQARHESSV